MVRLLRFLGKTGFLFLLTLSTSLAPHSWADGGPPAPALTTPLTTSTWAALDPLTRLLPIDSYSGPLNTPLAFAGARGEVVDGQLALFAAKRSWSTVQLTFSDLQGPKGAAIPHTLLRWRRVATVTTRPPYYKTRYVGAWPDPLMPAGPIDIAPQSRAFVWIDLPIPAEAQPGRYTGTVTISASDDVSRRVPLTLHVWGFTMPRTSHLLTAFGVGFNGKHPLDEEAADDDLIAHRITPLNCVGAPRVVTPPGPGQPGQWDWTNFDRRMRARLAQGITCVCVKFPDMSPDWGRAYQEHLEKNGWLNYAYAYVADEPPPAQWAAINTKMAVLKRAAPRLRTLVTVSGYHPRALQYVDIWCPAIVPSRNDYFDPEGSRRVQQRGQGSWWYVAYLSTAPSVNVWTDYPLQNDRIWPWLTWKHDVDGMLYWTTTNWRDVSDPLENAKTFLAANGDGELIYPDAQGKPIDSMRLEVLRDGLQDYEVFCLLEAGARELTAQHKNPSLVQQAQRLTSINSLLITSYKQFDPDPQALLTTREQMSATMEQIVKTLGHDPEIIGRPRLRSVLPPNFP